MVNDQALTKAVLNSGVDAGIDDAGTDIEARFPWTSGVLLSTLLFLAENHPPAVVIDGDVETYVSQMQGSILRETCYVVIACIGIMYLIRPKVYRFAQRSPVTLTFLSLIAWCIISTIWAQEPTVSAKRIIAYLFMITGAAGVATSWSRKHILQFISLSGAAHLTAGIVAEIVTGYFSPWVSDYRFAGTQSWNVQGFCCLLVVLSSLAAADSDPRHKAMFRIVALYGLTFLVLTRSRSSMVGLVVGYLIYLLLTQSFATKLWLSVTASVSVLMLYMSGLMTVLIDFLSRGGEGLDTLTGRQPLWEVVLTFVRQRPMTGYGYQDFWTVSNVDYFFDELHWRISSTHNSYLDNLVTLGYVGLVLHVSVLVFGVIWSSFLFAKTRSSIFALAAAMCAVFLVVGTLEAVIVISPGPYGFGVTLLIWVLCLDKVTVPHSKTASAGQGRVMRLRGHSIVET